MNVFLSSLIDCVRYTFDAAGLPEQSEDHRFGYMISLASDSSIQIWWHAPAQLGTLVRRRSSYKSMTAARSAVMLSAMSDLLRQEDFGVHRFADEGDDCLQVDLKDAPEAVTRAAQHRMESHKDTEPPLHTH